MTESKDLPADHPALVFMPASHLPPVNTPLVIKLSDTVALLAERTCYVGSKDSELEYLTASGIKIKGRFPWTYP